MIFIKTARFGDFFSNPIFFGEICPLPNSVYFLTEYVIFYNYYLRVNNLLFIKFEI